VPPTTIVLEDEQGHPIRRQRYRVVLEDGSELAGTLDDDGRAILRIEGEADVVFPDLADCNCA
jgi:hypothetical protein